MSIRIQQVNTCDRCKNEILEDEVYVDAMTYGATFHRHCWETMLGPVLARFLGLDEVKWRIAGSSGPDGGKVIYTDIPAFNEAAR